MSKLTYESFRSIIISSKRVVAALRKALKAEIHSLVIDYLLDTEHIVWVVAVTNVKVLVKGIGKVDESKHIKTTLCPGCRETVPLRKKPSMISKMSIT